MPAFMVADDAVNQHATNMVVTVEDLQAVLERYRTAVEGTYATWLGPGSERFRQFDAQFQQSQTRLIQALEQMQTEVAATGSAYDENQAAQEAAVGGLNSRRDGLL
jgi:uncharacterized protein YukE